MEKVDKMYGEAENKLKQITEQIDSKKAKEYTERIKLLEQEQMIMLQVYFNFIEITTIILNLHILVNKLGIL
jgi:hypothetical protein